MQVNFRYSDTNFISYLITLGYKYNNIEITKDKGNKIKVFVHFIGEKEELIKLHNNFINDNANINVLSFSKNRKQISKTIREEIEKYESTQRARGRNTEELRSTTASKHWYKLFLKTLLGIIRS